MNFLNIYFHGNKNKNRIALTFDDGPSQETEKVLDILKKYGAKATFFICGQRIKGREKIIKRILKEGHEIGNHTYSHKHLWFKSKAFIEKDIKKCDKELSKFGIKTDLFRFPAFKFGFNSLVVCWKLKKKIIFCDMLSNDWLNPWLKMINKIKEIKIKKVIEKTLNNTKKGSILNFHDYLKGIGRHKEIIPIMEKVVPELKKKKFKFVTVSEILKD